MVNSLRDFAKYVGLLPWGLFGTVIIFFPLANNLVSALPVVEGFENISSTVAFLVSAFCIFFLYSYRFEIAKKKDSTVRSQSALLFFLGICLLALYLSSYYTGESGQYGYYYHSYAPLQRSPIHLLFLEIPCYVSSFLCFTASFNLLALKEFLRKYVSKTGRFEGILSPNEEKTLFEVEGNGSFQRLETQAKGNPNSRMILTVDGSICWDESFEELLQKSSRYLRVYKRPSPQADAICAVELDLPKNFFRKLRFSVKNPDANSSLEIKGTVHFTTYETR